MSGIRDRPERGALTLFVLQLFFLNTCGGFLLELDELEMLWYVVLHSGNIPTNPGPQTRYPCSICYQPVRCNQKAPLCDLCELWSHCKCSGADNQVYSYYQYMEYLSWNCPRCMAKSLPFNGCLFLSSEDSILAGIDNDISDDLGLPRAITGLRIAHLNCRNLLSHKDEVLELTNLLYTS